MENNSQRKLTSSAAVCALSLFFHLKPVLISWNAFSFSGSKHKHLGPSHRRWHSPVTPPLLLCFQLTAGPGARSLDPNSPSSFLWLCRIVPACGALPRPTHAWKFRLFPPVITSALPWKRWHPLSCYSRAVRSRTNALSLSLLCQSWRRSLGPHMLKTGSVHH